MSNTMAFKEDTIQVERLRGNRWKSTSGSTQEYLNEKCQLLYLGAHLGTIINF